MRLAQGRSPLPSTIVTNSLSYTSSMYRKFRRLRVTIIVYACGSLCGILLFLNFSDEFKKLILQERHLESDGDSHVPGYLSRHSNGDQNESGKSPYISDITHLHSNRRFHGKLNTFQREPPERHPKFPPPSSTLIYPPSDKFWFMWKGTKFPSVETSTGKLWAEENPDSDRIIEQLMYITFEDINQEESVTGLNLGTSLIASGLNRIFGSIQNLPTTTTTISTTTTLSPMSSIEKKKTIETFSSIQNINPHLKSSSSSSTRNILETGHNIDGNSIENPPLDLSSSTIILPIVSNTDHKSIIMKKQSIPIKTILLYYGLGMSWGSHVISGRHVFMQQKCPVNSCRLTGNRSQMKEADVVVFKDVFMNPKIRRSPNQLWVMYMLECPLNTQNFIDKNVFNLTATYRHDSDIVTPYEKWVYYDDFIRGIPQGSNYGAGKSKKVAWFVSNCVAKNNRLEYARELGKYIEVDIYGACGSHSCSRANAKQCFELLSKTYKFYLAFENSNCRDYISEKFFVNGLGNNVLPIVMGAHPDDYRRAAPYKSYIHVDDFESPKELAKYLKELDENDEAYNEYFKWKGTGEFVNTHFFCRLCAMVHYADRSQSNTPTDINTSPLRLYKDFNDWWRGPNVCTRRSWRNQVDIFANKTEGNEVDNIWIRGNKRQK